MRKAGVVAVVVAAAVVLSPAVAIGGVHVTHPRDEAGYLDYLTTYGAANGQPLTSKPPDASLVAGGGEACAWLADQPWALLRTSGEYRFPATLDRYLASDGSGTGSWSGPPDRRTVAVAAWEYLCPATRYLQKPHYVFTQPQAD